MYATLAEVKAQIEKTTAGDDPVINAIIQAASENIERFCNRLDGFLAVDSAVARVYNGSGGPVQDIDECMEVTLVEVKDSATGSTYTPWLPGDWIAGSGDVNKPDFNRTPYRWLMADPTGDESYFTSGGHSGRPGFRPTSQGRRGVPTVRVTARWGYSDTVPPSVRQACITQVARWYKRGQSAWADTVASGEMGILMFRKALDPDVQQMLRAGRLVRQAVG